MEDIPARGLFIEDRRAPSSGEVRMLLYSAEAIPATGSYVAAEACLNQVQQVIACFLTCEGAPRVKEAAGGVQHEAEETMND